MADAPSPDSLDVEYEQLIQIVDLLTTGPLAIALTMLLAIGFLANITRFRYWRRCPVLHLLLILAKSPLVHWIGQFQAFVINVSYYNELYLVWAVLLLTGFSSFQSIIEYPIYTNEKKKLMFINEMIQLLNSFAMLALLLHYTLWYTKLGLKAYHATNDILYGELAPSDSSPLAGTGHFAIILWLIWGFSLIKIVYQITIYYHGDRLYGSADTAWVSSYMKRQKRIKNFDPKSMTGYRYLICEEKHPKVGPPPNYDITINDENLVTIEKVWHSEGWLFKSGGAVSDKLKDICLSFAMFKMLKRRSVEESENSEATWPETQEFIRHGLLEYLPRRVFKVIEMELKFLRDLFYTKYPTVFGLGFPLYALHFTIMFISLFGVFSKLHNYDPPKNDQDNYLFIPDIVVTKIILITVTVIEAWECIHFCFSNWSMVLLVCKYIKYQKHLDHFLINRILWLFCRIFIPPQTTHEIGQYSLLQCCKSSHCKLFCGVKFNCFWYTNGVGKAKYVKLDKVKVMEAIIPSMKRFIDTGLSHPASAISAISRHKINTEVPSWACELENTIQIVMIWHVATNFCWMVTENTKKRRRKNTNEKVVLALSNYCAYLVVQAPELLPINTFESKLICQRIVRETREFFMGTRKAAMLEKMKKVHDNVETVIGRGAVLGKMLVNEFKDDDVDLWEFLKDFWVELMLRLAPSEASVAHARKLAEGGELLTYLWVLLYHAGFPNQSSFKNHTASVV